MDPEQLAALERALSSRDFDRTSGAWTLAVSPFDLAALMRPISPAIDTRGLAAELIAAMAADAGLVLADRWADWNTTPFDEESPVHVSRYLRA